MPLIQKDAETDFSLQLLVAVRPDPRLEMQQTALEVARKYEEEAKERLRRINLVAAGLEVTNPKKQAGFDDAWFDHEDLPSAIAT